MFDQFAKVPSYFDWLVIISAFLSLILSTFAFLLIIFTRTRVKRAEELVKQIADAANKGSYQPNFSGSNYGLIIRWKRYYFL